MKRVLAFALLALATAACQPTEADANVLVELGESGGLEGLDTPQAELLVLDEQDRAMEVHVLDDDGTTYRVQTPMRVPCGAGFCDARLSLAPGTYRFELTVSALDRCDERARVGRFRSAPVTFGFDRSPSISFTEQDWSFDDDGDGIENVLETAVCGRYFVVDAARPATACADADDPCCAPTSDLIGRATRFDGGAHTLADGTPVTVAPFYLDATEVPYASFMRCVAAGACLRDKPTHAVRERLLEPDLDPRLPVTGLLPDEAEEYCAWRGARLPLDDEWDFAAAHRADGERGRYPWDPAALESNADATANDGHEAPASIALGCLPAEPFAANHRAPGRTCPRAARPVGSYPGTLVFRGTGAPLADLAGNAWEWTRDDTVDGTVLRGGGWDSVPQLLANDLRLVVTADEDLQRLKAVAGFRCARPLEADEEAATVDAALAPSPEPACEPEDADD